MNAKQKRLGRWSDEWPVVSLSWATCIRLDKTGPASGANGRNLYPRLVYRVRVMRSLRHRGAQLELLEIPPGASTTIARGPALRCSGPPLFSPNPFMAGDRKAAHRWVGRAFWPIRNCKISTHGGAPAQHGLAPLLQRRRLLRTMLAHFSASRSGQYPTDDSAPQITLMKRQRLDDTPALSTHYCILATKTVALDRRNGLPPAKRHTRSHSAEFILMWRSRHINSTLMQLVHDGSWYKPLLDLDKFESFL